jgi:hypothetical protein
VQVLCLAERERRLLATRFSEHANSHKAMERALRDAGATGALRLLDVLRRLERQHNIDLGEVCHRFAERNHPETHPIERFVMSYIAEERPRPNGGRELWVLVDRIAQVRELMDSRAVGEPS